MCGECRMAEHDLAGLREGARLLLIAALETPESIL
jgi:hypothetical protein